jgi:predicted PurR-regulated permease PerM
MSPRQESPANTLLRWALRIAAGALVAYVLWRTREIIVTVLIAAVLAAALEPVVDLLMRWRVPLLHPKTQRVAASVVVFAAFIAVCVFGTAWLAAPVGEEFRRLNPETVRQAFTGFAQDIQKVYDEMPPLLRQLVGRPDQTALTEALGRVAETLVRQVTLWLSHLLEIFLIPVLAFYFVVDSGSLKKYFLSFVPPVHRREAMRLVRDAGRVFRVYIAGQIVLCLIAGVVMGLLLAYWKVKYAVTLSVLAGVTRAVPIVGPIFSGAVIFVIILASNAKLALTVLVIFSVMHFVESKMIMPLLLGDLMELNPAVLLICILAAYEFFGILGMFLAAPVAAMARTLITALLSPAAGRRGGAGGTAGRSGGRQSGRRGARRRSRAGRCLRRFGLRGGRRGGRVSPVPAANVPKGSATR